MRQAARWRTLLAIYAGTLLVRALTGIFIHEPGFTDSYYYYHVASNLFAGRGFVEDFIWNYLDAAPTVTHASNAYWGPLASLLVLPSFWVFGPSFRAAQIPIVLVSALLPVLTYLTAQHLLLLRATARPAQGPLRGPTVRDKRLSVDNDLLADATVYPTAVCSNVLTYPNAGAVGENEGSRGDEASAHRTGILAAVLTIFSGIYLPYWTIPEGYVPFAIAGAAALLSMSLGLAGDWRWSAASGASIAVAQLARSDGALLLCVLLAIWGWRIWTRTSAESALRLAAHLLAAGLAYAFVMAPWLYRNWIDFGSPTVNPGISTLFLREYNDVFSYQKQLDLSYYLGWGFAAIVRSKVLAAVSNLHVLAEAVSYYLAPLVIAGFVTLWRNGKALPFLGYLIALYVAMTLAFTFPGPLGSLLHSLAALLPFLMVAAALGLDSAVGALVRWRTHLSEARAKLIFGGVLLVAQAGLTLGLGAIAVSQWGGRYSYALYPEAITWLQPRLRAEEPVMIIDPPAYTYFSSGRPAIVVPNDEPQKIAEVARHYGARFILLEPALPRPLVGLYRGDEIYPDLTLRSTLQNGQGQELKVFELIR